MWKYDVYVPPNICRGTYVATTKLITKSCKKNIKTDDDINVASLLSVLTLCDDTMNCDTVSRCDANDTYSIYSNVFDNHA